MRDPLKPPQVKKAIINRGNWGVYYKYSFIRGKERGQLTVQGKTVQIEYMAPGGTYLPQRFVLYPFKAK